MRVGDVVVREVTAQQASEVPFVEHDDVIGSVTAGMVLGGLLAAAPLRAESKERQVDEITCEEFLAPYWVDGYQPVGVLVEECKAAPRDTLWQ